MPSTLDPVPAHPPDVHPVPSDGRRHTGQFEQILRRMWAPAMLPPPQLIRAVDRLAEMPSHLAGRLVSGLDVIYVGLGMVTDYPPFADLAGQPIHPARPGGPTWEHIPAGYRNRQIVIGSGGAPLTRDLMLHELFHALDDLDGMISDSLDFRALHATCRPVLADERYSRQRAEFFAEAGAIVFLREWDVLERLLSGHLERAYSVRSWFIREYGVGGR